MPSLWKPRRSRRAATLGEIAKVLGVNRHTLYVRCLRGEVRGIRFIGGRYEMSRTRLEQLVAEKERNEAPAA